MITLRRYFLSVYQALFLCLMGVLFHPEHGFAQDKPISRLLFQQGMEMLDAEYVDSGIEKLRMAAGYDPSNLNIKVQIARGLAMKGEYLSAINELSPIISNRQGSPLSYQLFGNSLDMIGKTEEAIEFYLEGVVLFPKAGNLYLELGIVEFARDNPDIALMYWEEGIKNAPDYLSNYYWATKGFAKTNEPVRALIYGEYFLNIERDSERAQEISQLLFSIYEQCIEVRDSQVVFSFSDPDSRILNVSPKARTKHFTLEEAYIYTWHQIWELNSGTVNLKTLNQARKDFIDYWSRHFSKKYTISVLLWQEELLDAGLMDGYNYWLLKEGAQEEFGNWYDRNRIPYKKYEIWFDSYSFDIPQKSPIPWSSEYVYSPF